MVVDVVLSVYMSMVVAMLFTNHVSILSYGIVHGYDMVLFTDTVGELLLLCSSVLLGFVSLFYSSFYAI